MSEGMKTCRRGRIHERASGGSKAPPVNVPNPEPNLYSLSSVDPELREQIETCLLSLSDAQAAALPALHLVNGRLGYVPPQAVVEIAELLGLAPAQVQDTLSFYGFFKQDKPQGQFRVWVCRSISCAACGGEELLEHLCEKLGIRPGETTPDGRVTLEFAECLGACERPRRSWLTTRCMER